VPVVGSRFLIEAGFIIAVAVVAGIERLSTWWIIAVVAGAWLIVAAVEIVFWARGVVRRQPQALAEPEPVFTSTPAYVEPVPTVVIPPVPVAETPPEPIPTAPERAAEPESKPAPPPPPPRITAAPPLPPEPEPESAPEPVEEPAPAVAYLPMSDSPREWNLWELERATRDHAGDDVARNEERSYLLMYLREFAGPDGVLPTDFDGLVRDAFGDVLQTFA
jgi:type IV secretory pathway VirB10-like protein